MRLGKEDITEFIKQLEYRGLLGIKLDTYKEAWEERNRINTELRIVGVKNSYSSSINGELLVYWLVNKFGNRGGKTLAFSYADIFEPQGIVHMQEPTDDWVDPANEDKLNAIREEILKRKEQDKNAKLNDILSRI